MRDDFVVFILSHGRANSLVTVDSLNRCGYTGKWYIILDDEDSQIDLYKQKFGEENIIIFNKAEALKKFDIMDNFDDDKTIVFARNICHQTARDLGYKYFLELEDDYTNFIHREPNGKKLETWYIRDLDAVIDTYIEFLETSKCTTVCFAQTGDFIGGVGTTGPVYREKLARKAMNSFFCKSDNEFMFFGRFNDDVNTYLKLGSIGKLFFTTVDVNLGLIGTQITKGGLTDSYLKFGTYVKSFYSIMICPSCTKIYTVGSFHKRLHHIIDWDLAVPKIISSRFKR